MTVAEFLQASLLVTAIAMLIERTVGYPDRLVQLVGHPVIWVGNLIGWCDLRFNNPASPDPRRKFAGVCTLLFVAGVTGAVSLAAMLFLRSVPFGWIAEAVLASSLISQKELGERVEAVADGLDQNLEQGREAVRHIVGRDHRSLSESEVAKGAIESLAENSSDGVVAPVLWMLLGGLFGTVLYKTVNTLDSMIGYKTERHRAFGWASARFDDLLNLVPARLTGLLYCFCMLFLDRGRASLGWKSMWRDAPKHVSPNAGYPEAAMAGSLDVALGGPRSYGGNTVELAYMGSGRQTLAPNDVRAAVALYKLMLTVLTCVLLAPVIFMFSPSM
ncbi:MAG: adenosylcobinamide-phosphate synthase CbiB [Pseudomonadota bacterium]